MHRWYVIYTHAREEGIAEENLSRQGFETYWPRYRKRTSHARREREVSASLFPRYLFARFDALTDGWRVIRSTRGVIGIVSQGSDPVPVSDRLIEDMRGRQDERGHVVLGRQAELRKGQRIRLEGAAFESHDLIFEASKDADRVIALLRLLGRDFEVAVPISSVIPAGA